MTPTDWENVARCARFRHHRALWEGHIHDCEDDRRRARDEWESWQAAQALSGRTPF
jgi:hypothetical protein